MKKLTLLIICTCFSMLYTYSQDVIYKPEGALIQSLRNDDESEIMIPGCNDGLKMDNINNLYGNYWGFYLVGTVDNLSNITVKPYCSARRIALQKGCGYVANYNDGRGDVYVRIYVTKMVTSTSGEIIGATLLYQTNYQSKYEMERAAQARAEREASKIFWNGGAVPDATLRKILLGKFDTDNDGKISQVEAAKKNSLQIQGGSRMTFYETGIANLTGLTSLTFTETNIAGEIKPSLPNLHRFVLQGNGPTISLLDLTGCQNIDTVKVGRVDIDKMNLRNCKSLRSLDFSSKYYTTINELLDVSGCTALSGDIDLYGVRGKSFDFSGNTGILQLSNIPQFCDVNLSGCTSLNYLSGYEGPKGYELKKLNLERCYQLRDIHFVDYTLSELNLSDCINIERLSLKNLALSELDLSKNRKLSSVTLDSTAIKTLDLSNMKHLSTLSCYDGDLKALNVSGCDSLWSLWCNSNKLESINLANCHNLKELYCHNNKLMALDVSDCDSLQFLHCYRNPSLAFLDVTHNSKLEGIQCSNTAIQELDISRSETTEWASSEPGDPIRVPGATQGFKTLWIHEKQKIEVYTREGSEFKRMFKPMKDKDFDKALLLSAKWDELRQEYKKSSPKDWKADLDFKIKVRK